jgi:hypothetical protein
LGKTEANDFQSNRKPNENNIISTVLTLLSFSLHIAMSTNGKDNMEVPSPFRLHKFTLLNASHWITNASMKRVDAHQNLCLHFHLTQKEFA